MYAYEQMNRDKRTCAGQSESGKHASCIKDCPKTQNNLPYKRRYVCLFICLFVCMRAMAGQTAGPIKNKLGMGTHVDPGSVLVTWRRLAKANKTHRGPQGPRE